MPQFGLYDLPTSNYSFNSTMEALSVNSLVQTDGYLRGIEIFSNQNATFTFNVKK